MNMKLQSNQLKLKIKQMMTDLRCRPFLCFPSLLPMNDQEDISSILSPIFMTGDMTHHAGPLLNFANLRTLKQNYT